MFFFTKNGPSFPHRGAHLNDQIIRNDSKSFHTQAEPHWKRNPRNNPRFVWIFSGLKLGGWFGTLLEEMSTNTFGVNHWILQNHAFQQTWLKQRPWTTSCRLNRSRNTSSERKNNITTTSINQSASGIIIWQQVNLKRRRNVSSLVNLYGKNTLQVKQLRFVHLLLC